MQIDITPGLATIIVLALEARVDKRVDSARNREPGYITEAQRDLDEFQRALITAQQEAFAREAAGLVMAGIRNVADGRWFRRVSPAEHRWVDRSEQATQMPFAQAERILKGFDPSVQQHLKVIRT